MDNIENTYLSSPRAATTDLIEKELLVFIIQQEIKQDIYIITTNLQRVSASQLLCFATLLLPRVRSTVNCSSMVKQAVDGGWWGRRSGEADGEELGCI